MLKFRPVLVTPPSGDIVTLTEMKSWARIDFSDDDTLVSALMNGAVEKLDGWSGILGRCLLEQTWRQDFYMWQRDFRLPFPDVSAVTVKYYDTSNVEQTVSSTNYELLEDHEGCFVRLIDNYTGPNLYDDRSNSIQITLTAGYGEAADVPQPIKNAIMALASHWYEHREAVGDSMAEMPLHAMSMIEPYRRRRI